MMDDRYFSKLSIRDQLGWKLNDEKKRNHPNTKILERLHKYQRSQTAMSCLASIRRRSPHLTVLA